jgi:hypothetical protein
MSRRKRPLTVLIPHNIQYVGMSGGATMSGPSAGFRVRGATCETCSEPFSLFRAVNDFQSIEKLPDPFSAKCPKCAHEADYPKSAIVVVVSIG